MVDTALPSNTCHNVVKLANQDELAKARETLSKVIVPDLPAEIIARAYMRLQCADVPREPWHCEVCQILQTPQVTPSETCDALSKCYDAFSIGSAVRTPETLLANIENAKRRSQCLGAIESTFFTQTLPDDEGEDYEECAMSWGADPAEYVEQFRAALAALKAPTLKAPAVPDMCTCPYNTAISSLLVDPLCPVHAANGRASGD